MSAFTVEVVKVGRVRKHPNADRLDIATVKGWDCIVGRGQFKPGDLAYYIPIDAILPPEYIKAHGLNYLKKGGRIHTVQLRGEYSQGLLVEFNQIDDVDFSRVKVGDDLKRYLGITKWEPPFSSGDEDIICKGNPYIRRYTDIQHLNNYPDAFCDSDMVVVTEKIHGRNIRMGWLLKDRPTWWERLKTRITGKPVYEWVTGSHNMQTGPKSMYAKAAEPYKAILAKYPMVIFYGELYGPGMQKGYSYDLSRPSVCFFDAYDISIGQYLGFITFNHICHKEGLDQPPLVFLGYWKHFKHTEPQGPSKLDPDTLLEGHVIKLLDEDLIQGLGRGILKNVSREYLAAQGKKGGTDFH